VTLAEAIKVTCSWRLIVNYVFCVLKQQSRQAGKQAARWNCMRFEADMRNKIATTSEHDKSNKLGLMNMKNGSNNNPRKIVLKTKHKISDFRGNFWI